MPRKSRTNPLASILQTHPVIIGLAIRLLLTFSLPALLDDGLLLQGVRYTDIDYDVFTDAAAHVAEGRSPYDRHTYRYTPFLAKLLALPMGRSAGVLGWLFSTKYFGKILFCIADVICGYIIVFLRRKQRLMVGTKKSYNGGDKKGWKKLINVSPELIDALWWLYNPLPINICTRGSAESLVVLLPVLATMAVADMYKIQPSSSSSSSSRWSRGTLPIMVRACFAGILHGIGIHAKLYPVIYTISFMANFSKQQQQREMLAGGSTQQQQKAKSSVGWRYPSSEQMQSKAKGGQTFPWTNPMQIIKLAMFWVQRLFLTMSSILFLVFSLGTAGILQYLAVHYDGQIALDEGLLYHFVRVDHRHNYSMYWYWIYLARGKAEAAISQLAGSNALAENALQSSPAWGYIPLIPQVLILGFSSLGIAPYDLSFALFCQTFAFVAFNKVITAQYFTWYLCLLPLCSDRINWNSKRMYFSLGLLIVAIVTWLLSAFTLEMLGWRSHRQVYLASLFFFLSNVNLLSAILNGYSSKKQSSANSPSGEGRAKKTKLF